MQKNLLSRKWLAVGISITAVVILILATLTNVAGYQTIQTSQQNLITERINQRELLFQTIVDLVNNKEIQRIILKSQISKGIFPVSNIPILTTNQLKQIYVIGLILSKVVSKSRIHSMVQQYQSINPEIQKEISSVIEKDATFNDKITQLQTSQCDCENDSMVKWDFPVMCEILLYIAAIFSIFPYLFFPIWGGAFFIAIILECYWTLP